tara:strand:- start:382 stop:3033 length:2652 start_codon:yes stop_codon:yes gene_type:complete
MITPKQQKAQFSAFDTTSRFRSGLRDVGQALTSLGQSAQTYGEVVKKRKAKAQTIIADKAEENRLDQFNKAFAEYEGALNSGNNEAINSTFENLERIRNADFTSFVPENMGGTLEDEEIIGAYNNAFNKSTSRRLADAAFKQNEMIVLNNATDNLQSFIGGESEFAVNHLGTAASDEQLRQHYAGQSFLLGSNDTGLEGEPLETLNGEIKKAILTNFTNNIKLTVSEDSRTAQVNYFKELTKEAAHLGWTPQDIQKIEDAMLQTVEESTAAVDALMKQAEDLIPRAESLLSGSTPKPGEVDRYASELNQLYQVLKVNRPADDAKLERLHATVNLASLYIVGDNEPSVVQVMNEYRMANPSANADQAINEVLTVLETSDAKKPKDSEGRLFLYLDSSALSKLRNSLDNTKTSVERSLSAGSADFMQYVVPGFREEMVAARNDPAKRRELEAKYFEYRKQNPKIYGEATPSQFFLPVADKFPDKLDGQTLEGRYKNELKQNSLVSLNYYANSKLLDPNTTTNEAAYYLTVYTGTNDFIAQGLTDDQAQTAFGNSDMFQLLQLAVNATDENKQFAKDIIKNADSGLAMASKSMQNTNPAVSKALELLITGLMQDSVADDYDGKLDKLQEAEKGRILNNIGYADLSNSSGTVFVPPSIMQKYADQGQVGFNWLFGDAVRGYFTNKLHPERVSLLYQAAVAAAIADKYGERLDQASQLEKIAEFYKPQPADDGFPDPYENYSEFLSRTGYMSEELYYREKMMPFVIAFANGSMSNSMEVEGEEKPRVMLNLPTSELHDGQVEQRIYFTPHTMSGGVTKVGLDNGELVYITLPEVDAIMSEYVKAYVNPLAKESDPFFGESPLRIGFGRQDSIVESAAEAIFQSKTFRK